MATKADQLINELLEKLADNAEYAGYITKIQDAKANTPFWAKENELLRARDSLEWECEQAKTLQDAIICGANMTYLDDDNGEWKRVGYMNDGDGTFEIYDKQFENVCLSDIPVEFYSLDKDDDGYTIAIFKKTKPTGCIVCGKPLDEDKAYCDECWTAEQKRLNNNEEK